MSKLTRSNKVISEKVLELRYKPKPAFLDLRGQIVESILPDMKMSEWQVVENQVEFGDKDKQRRIFISYKNAGLVILNTTDPDYFVSNATRFTELLLMQGPFISFFCERIGIRFRYSVEYKGTFESLLQRFTTKFNSSSTKVQNAINGQIIDTSYAVNLRTDFGFVNIKIGPIKQDQLETLFSEKPNMFSVSSYFDFDAWSRPQKLMNADEINKEIETYSRGNQERFEQFLNLVLE